MRRAKRGDAAAFGELVARHRRAALRVATVVLGHDGDADDVVQVASERTWRAVDSIDEHRGFRGWYLHSVANTARNHRRGRGRRAAAELRLAARADRAAPDPSEHAVSADERRDVLSALNRLDADDRLVIALRHFEQLSESEMAQVLDCPTGTVKSRLSRSMQRLRAALNDGGGAS